MAAKVERVSGTEVEGYSFFCEGCVGYHMFYTRPWRRWNPATQKLSESLDGPVWTFNGDVEKPTFSPSLVVHEVVHEGKQLRPRCHLFVREGRVQFLTDCGHALAGKTVDLLDVDKTPF